MITQQAVDEYIKCRDDKVYFIEKYCKTICPNDGVISIKLYEWQKDYINKKNIQVDTARQIGFSLLANLNILHTIIFKEDKTIFKFSCYAVSSEQFKIVYDLCSYEFKPKLINKNKKLIVTENGNKIYFENFMVFSPKGFSIDEVYFEEFQFTRDKSIRESFVYSIVPTIVKKDSNIWVWSALSNDTKTEIKRLEQHTLPFWVTSNESYNRYKKSIMYVGVDNTKRELIV